MTTTQALIEAAEEYMFGSDENLNFREIEQRKLSLRAAISSAKAAEEGVETINEVPRKVDPAVKLLADVMHLWVDGYISKNPDSLASGAISCGTFAEVESFLATQGYLRNRYRGKGEGEFTK